MRYLILSDLHSNWEALEAVWRDASGDYEQLVCCGDLIGYGADPNRVIEWVRIHAVAVVRGNHDKACAGLEDLRWFNAAARAAAEWTMAHLTAENLRYLRSLPRGPLAVGDFQILHGSPTDEDEYLIHTPGPEVACALMALVSFFGHTHFQGGFVFHRNSARRLAQVAPDQRRLRLELEPQVFHLINPGAVGQPRDGDPRAAYAIYDQAERIVELRRVPYAVQTAQAKILRAGLPELLAHRLADGF